MNYSIRTLHRELVIQHDKLAKCIEEKHPQTIIEMIERRIKELEDGIKRLEQEIRAAT